MKKTQLIIAVAALLGMTMIASPASAHPTVEPAEATSVVATFDVHGEIFRVRFTDPAAIKRAREVLAGKAKGHPNGTIRYGFADVNVGYSWHLSPVRWADMSIEVCDGLPSNVENHEITSPQYCPWAPG